MKAPVYFYFGLKRYHQNHRRYVSSRDDYQLEGSLTRSEKDLDRTCRHKITVGNKIQMPCGLVASSFFTDTYIGFHH
eukprot:GSMAST32.ASY1.ANO1.803.1 assembled CDS